MRIFCRHISNVPKTGADEIAELYSEYMIGDPNGNAVWFGDDAKQMKEQEFEGVIPPIAEKEKRGKKVKRPKDEPYVRELEPKRDGSNIPAVD